MTISLGPSASTGSLQADEVKVNGIDINTLISERIYSLFRVTPGIGLPSSTDFTVTRSDAGLYEIEFVDSWNSQFADVGYSITLSSKSLRKGNLVDVPGHNMVLNWFDKTNEGFKISAVEHETAINGDVDTNVDLGVIDLQCARGMVVFCAGSFIAFGSNLGPI